MGRNKKLYEAWIVFVKFLKFKRCFEFKERDRAENYADWLRENPDVLRVSVKKMMEVRE